LGSCSGNTSGIGSSSVAWSGVGRLLSPSISASLPLSRRGDLVADLEPKVRMTSPSATTSGRGLGPPWGRPLWVGATAPRERFVPLPHQAGG
jgi:hypothetical protein